VFIFISYTTQRSSILKQKNKMTKPKTKTKTSSSNGTPSTEPKLKKFVLKPPPSGDNQQAIEDSYTSGLSILAMLLGVAGLLMKVYVYE
jgi:hypothetical protein